jgi:DNA-binding transcriptional MerR regulator
LAAEKLHIGELAARTGRSVHTIRWYEAQGLIPGVERDPGGRRIYGELHLGWLDLIDRLRRTGMSIAEIRDYAALAMKGRRTLRQRQELLAAHRSKVEATIGEYQAALQLIDSKIAFYEEWIDTGQQPAAVPLSDPARQLTGTPKKNLVNGSFDDLVSTSWEGSWEPPD